MKWFWFSCTRFTEITFLLQPLPTSNSASRRKYSKNWMVLTQTSINPEDDLCGTYINTRPH